MKMDEFEREIKTEPALKIPKIEPIDTEMKPEIALIPPTLSWRPKLGNLSDLMFFDGIDEDLDVSLGDSLFESKSKDSASFDARDSDEPENRKWLTPFRVNQLLSEHFKSNSHPAAMEMLEIAESVGCRYRTVFEKFEKLRKRQNVKCVKNDACHRIRNFFVRDTATGEKYSKVDEESRKIMDEQIQTHILSRKRFSLAYVHAIMEKLGPTSNFSPTFIRGQYESWKKKMMTMDREKYICDKQKRIPEDQPSVFSIDVLRKLEDAYLTRKYECQDANENEWSSKEIGMLAHHLDVDTKSVAEWIEKRRGAVLGLDHDVIEFRKKQDERRNEMKAIKRLSAQKMGELDDAFERNNRPTREERLALVRKLGLKEDQVKNYFTKRLSHQKKLREWEDAKQKVLSLPKDKIIVIDRIATQKRKTAEENKEIAERMGISYRTLCNFIDFKKSRTIAMNDD